MADEPRRVTNGKTLPFHGLAWLVAGLLLALMSFSGQAFAKPVASSIMVDAVTGAVISSSNADVSTYPASLTKMMTLYLLFDALKHGQIKLTDSIVFSDHAASQDATNLAVSQGASIKVETAILAVVVRSANDAATAIGERLAGSEWAFAKKMTQTARALGMKNTTYLNANGLPNPGQRTTARDQAILAVALLRDFPEYYHYFAAERFSYRGVQYAGHNRVLNKLNGADGIKTGYIRASGFNLVSSAEQNGRRLVGVVLGGSTPYLRDKQMVAMMTKGFKTPASGSGTMLALSAPNSAGPSKAPAVVAAAAPVSVPAAMIAAAAMAPVDAGQPVVAGNEEDDAIMPASISGDPLLPVLKPGSGLQLQFADATPPDSQAIENVWRSGNTGYGVQVGAYAQYAPAQKAAVRATRSLPEIFADSRIAIDESNKLYRARVTGLTKADAEKACAQLKAQRTDCMVFTTDDGLAKAN
ncbi:D-alanyl-D-alanine carboxypeptidase [Dongia sedimenti]|uniref:D-alanyl-D-alanine carboxypeptidase n=1 Tax=Dongia sedimenti TaxID=3064282 RepID=A0ABU0YVH5_9PROT|nr:D-alanyl-D-alanine carboxypeptidase [Rhodospirillaceae bacterium R-7]